MFKDRLRSARISRGYTLQEIADALEVTLVTIQKYERGAREPSLQLLGKLADILDVPTDFLLGRDEYLKNLGVSVDVPPEGPPRHPKPQKSRQVQHTLFSDSNED